MTDRAVEKVKQTVISLNVKVHATKDCGTRDPSWLLSFVFHSSPALDQGLQRAIPESSGKSPRLG